MLATIYGQSSRPQQKASTAWGCVQGDDVTDQIEQSTDRAQNNIQSGVNQPLKLPENEFPLPIFDPFSAFVKEDDNVCPEYPGISYTRPACAEERFATMSPPFSGFYELSRCQPCMYLCLSTCEPSHNFLMVTLTNPLDILFAGRCTQTATISIVSNRWRSYGVVQRLSQAYVSEFSKVDPLRLGDKISYADQER